MNWIITTKEAELIILKLPWRNAQAHMVSEFYQTLKKKNGFYSIISKSSKNIKRGYISHPMFCFNIILITKPGKDIPKDEIYTSTLFMKRKWGNILTKY